jgi:hypothetical protein
LRTAWHVTIPAIAIVPADSAEDAERYVAEHLERAGFYPYEENRAVIESDTTDPETFFCPRRWR